MHAARRERRNCLVFRFPISHLKELLVRANMRDITLLSVAVWASRRASLPCSTAQETRIYQSVKRLAVSEFKREEEWTEEVENWANSLASERAWQENIPILRLDALPSLKRNRVYRNKLSSVWTIRFDKDFTPFSADGNRDCLEDRD